MFACMPPRVQAGPTIGQVFAKDHLIITVKRSAVTNGEFTVDAVLKQSHFRVQRKTEAFVKLFQKLHLQVPFCEGILAILCAVYCDRSPCRLGGAAVMTARSAQR